MLSAVLVVLAHQDDEVAIASRIAFERKAGSVVYCAYLTDGAGHGSDPQVRCDESLKVLASLDVSKTDVVFLGVEEHIGDGSLIDCLDKAHFALREWIVARPEAIRRIYCPAWEGGHPDHDAAHIIALALARNLGLHRETWQFSVYNARGAPPNLFRVMHLPKSETAIDRKLSFRDGLWFALLAWRYPSQRRTWVGLFPEAFVKYAVLRRERISQADPELVRRVPGEGTLLYERLFSVTYASFAARASQFIAEQLD